MCLTISHQILDNVNFIVMENGKLCPPGTDFSEKECTDAYHGGNQMDKTMKSKGLVLDGITTGNHTDVPYRCSIKTGSKTSFYYNSQKIKTTNLISFKNGDYNMICKRKSGNISYHLPALKS